MQITKETLTRIRVVLTGDDVERAIIEMLDRNTGFRQWESGRKITLKITVSGVAKAAEVKGFCIDSRRGESPKPPAESAGCVLPAG